MSWNIESKTGADLGGSNGATNRTYTLAKSNVIAGSIRITSADYPQVEGGGYTYNATTNVITFIKNVWNDYVIQIQYEYDTSGVSSPSADSLRYTTILNFNKYMLMNVHIPNRNQTGTFPTKEEIGTGDDSETQFTFDNGEVIENTDTLYYGATEATATATLTRTTHYTIDYDTGVITLTSAGVTLLSTNTIYATYDYNKYQLSNSAIKQALLSAEADLDNHINTVFYDGTATTPDFEVVTDELHKGQGKYDKSYQTNTYPLNDTSTTLDGSVSADDGTITVVSTQGFPTSGSFAVETNKIAYTGKTGTTFTGCTNVLAHDDGKMVTSWIVEQSLDSEGTSPTWQVLQPDTEYSINFVSGHIKLNDISTTGTTYLDAFHPQRGVWDRVRLTYQSGYDQIYNDVITGVHMMAGLQLFEGNVLNALARKTDGFDTGGVGSIENKIKRIIQKYECWLIKALKP